MFDMLSCEMGTYALTGKSGTEKTGLASQLALDIALSAMRVCLLSMDMRKKDVLLIISHQFAEAQTNDPSLTLTEKFPLRIVHERIEWTRESW